MTAPPAAKKEPINSGRSSALIGAGILLSRLLGLVRQSLIAAYLGAGWVADAFNGAFRLTNILQNLFGEGVLSASFIPVYSAALETDDRKSADRIAGAVGALLGVATALLVILGMTFAPFVTKLFVGGWTGDKLALTTALIRILFPGAGAFVMGAWCLGILNSHRRFFLSYAAPVFWNLAMIAALLWFGGKHNEVDLALKLGYASVVGAVLQFAVQMPTVLALSKHMRLNLDASYPPVKEVVRNFVPAFFARGVVWFSTYIDTQIASYIMVDGIYTLLQNATTIYVLPISLFGMTASAAELPELSRDSAAGGELAFERLRARLNSALPRIAYFVVPSAVGFLVLGQAIVAVLLQHRKFTETDSIRTWAILAGSSVGLVASALGRLYSSTFYALRDTRTPVKFAILRVTLTGILGYLFAFPLPRLLGLPAWTGAAGLTASAGIAGWLEFLLLRNGITKRIGPTGIERSRLVKLWLSAAVSGAIGYGVMLVLVNVHHSIRGACAIAAFAIAYGGLTVALGIPEARGIMQRVLRR